MTANQGGQLLPWQLELWRDLQSAWHADHLPGAILLTGMRGVGKQQLFHLFANSVLCQSPDAQGMPCGHCADCVLVQAGTHPDWSVLTPDIDAKTEQITVAQIRDAIGAETLTSTRGGAKFILIDPADGMNPAAANALLKTLEEPRKRTYIFLLSASPNRLLATIRSRCMLLKAPTPSFEEATQWLLEQGIPQAEIAVRLQLSLGAPLRAKDSITSDKIATWQLFWQAFCALSDGTQSPLEVAKNWEQQGPSQTLEWLSMLISDLIRLTIAKQQAEILCIAQSSQLQQMAEHLTSQSLHPFLKQIFFLRQRQSASLSWLLQFESLAIDWIRICARHGLIAKRSMRSSASNMQRNASR